MQVAGISGVMFITLHNFNINIYSDEDVPVELIITIEIYVQYLSVHTTFTNYISQNINRSSNVVVVSVVHIIIKYFI